MTHLIYEIYFKGAGVFFLSPSTEGRLGHGKRPEPGIQVPPLPWLLLDDTQCLVYTVCDLPRPHSAARETPARACSLQLSPS